MHTIEIPPLGETIEGGKVLCWMKQVGDSVQEGDPLVEIETDKINIEIVSTASGILRAILAPEGASLSIGTIIAFIGEANEPFADTTLLLQPPIVVRQHSIDKTHRDHFSLLTTLNWQGGLSALLLLLFLLQYREIWIATIIVSFFLVSFGFYLGRNIERAKDK